MTDPALPPRLLALTPGEMLPGVDLGRQLEQLERRVVAALDGGLRGVLLREPALGDRDTLELARRLARRLEPVQGWLGIHDRAHLAELCGAHGVHLGFRSLTPVEARGCVAPELALGLSTHAADDPERWRGANYRFYGPIFATPSKEGVLEPVGIAGLAAACSDSDTPIWALGGVEVSNAGACLAAGARGLAVRGALLGSQDPKGSAEALMRTL